MVNVKIMPEVKITNLVKFFTLLLLSEGPKHGYEIIKEAEGKIGKRPSPGQIYPFLKDLQKHKYIKSKGVGERDKQVYFLTKEGKGFVNRVFERFSGLIDIAIKPNLTVCTHCKCEIYKGGFKTKLKGRTMDFCCKDCAASFGRLKI